VNLVLPGPLGSRVTSSSIGRRGAGVGEAGAHGALGVAEPGRAAACQHPAVAGVGAGQTAQVLPDGALVHRGGRTVRLDDAAPDDGAVLARLGDRAAQEAGQKTETDQRSHGGGTPRAS